MTIALYFHLSNLLVDLRFIRYICTISNLKEFTQDYFQGDKYFSVYRISS